MKPAPFRYADPATLEEVLAELAAGGDDAVVIAGGQSLVPLMNLRLARPEVVIDPRRVKGLRDIQVTPTGVDIGALVTVTQLLGDESAAAALPGVHEALGQIGHSQIRNRTTVGGSLAHADPAAELPAVLLGSGGHVVLESAARGPRTVAAGDFFDGPFSTTRRPDELLTGVHVPVFGGPTGWAEVSRRPGDFALVGLFAGVSVDEGGRIAAATLALSGVADRPRSAPAAEAMLVGHLAGTATIEQAATAIAAEVSPSDDGHASGAHRSALCATLVRRLLPRLVGAPPRPGTTP